MGGRGLEQRIRDELKTLRDAIVQSMPVDQIYLFGSYARGMPHRDSDIDLYVILPTDASIRDIDAMKLIRRAIRDKKTMPVDVIVAKRDQFEQRKTGPTMEREIASEGVVLYG